MNEFLQLAQVLGEQIKSLLEPVKLQIEQLSKKNAELEERLLSVDEVAEKAAKLVPIPKDGKDGAAPDEAAIIAAVSAQFERRFSDQVLSMERQARDAFEKAIDKMPIPKDGKDALPIEQIEIELEERALTIKLGDTVKTLTLPALIDRGVWAQGEYEKGDCVSYDGCLWIAQEDTRDAPSTNKSWRLAVKKGRNGRDLRDNASGYNHEKGLKV